MEKSADALSSTFVITQGKKTREDRQVRGNKPLSTHLEADYRIVTHLPDAIKCGYTSTLRGNDTDILVILMAFMPTFLQRSPNFQLRYIGGPDGSDTYDVNVICSNLGVERCRGLLFFHAFTGCDYISSFYRIGKKKFFDLFLVDKSCDDVFNELSCAPSSDITEQQIDVICKFVLKAYKTPKHIKTLAAARRPTRYDHSSTIR